MTLKFFFVFNQCSPYYECKKMPTFDVCHDLLNSWTLLHLLFWGQKGTTQTIYLCQHAFDLMGKWSNATVQLSAHRFIKVTSWFEFMARKNNTGTLKIVTDLFMLIMMTRF